MTTPPDALREAAEHLQAWMERHDYECPGRFNEDIRRRCCGSNCAPIREALKVLRAALAAGETTPEGFPTPEEAKSAHERLSARIAKMTPDEKAALAGRLTHLCDEVDEADAMFEEGRREGIEEAARVIDECNREGPYQAIMAAPRIRALASPSSTTRGHRCRLDGCETGELCGVGAAPRPPDLAGIEAKVDALMVASWNASRRQEASVINAETAARAALMAAVEALAAESDRQHSLYVDAAEDADRAKRDLSGLRERVEALEDALRACLDGGSFKHPQIVERARAALSGSATDDK